MQIASAPLDLHSLAKDHQNHFLEMSYATLRYIQSQRHWVFTPYKSYPWHHVTMRYSVLKSLQWLSISRTGADFLYACCVPTNYDTEVKLHPQRRNWENHLAKWLATLRAQASTTAKLPPLDRCA
jgi:hypothetical protein